jgi:hypothetical protein
MQFLGGGSKKPLEYGKPSRVKKLALIVGASLREQMRWARQHLYTLLILTPIVLGLSYATVSRLASEAPSFQPTFIFSLIFSVGLLLCLIGLSLSRAASEIYHLRRPESVLDYLPVSRSTQIHVAWAKRILRTVALAILVLVVRVLTGVGKLLDAEIVLPLIIFTLVISLVEVVAALCWIHWSHVRNKVQAINSLVIVTVSGLIAGSLLLKLIRPLILPLWVDRGVLLLGAVWVIGLYFLMRVLHRAWRAFDIEFAKRLQSGARATLIQPHVFERRFPRNVAVQLARDLQLTLRAFSSAVYVSLFVFVLLGAVLFTVLTTGWLPSVAMPPSWLDATWLPSVMIVKIACVLATTSMSVLVAVIVAFELPHFWLERATGTSGKDMWQSKLWYARLVSLPAPLVMWVIGFITGGVPLFYALPLLLECIWLWWLVSTLIGALAFEIPDRPELALVVMVSFGATFGLLVSIFWPIGILLFALNGIRSLTIRGQARASFCLITEGD